METPLLSICIPTYRRAPYLQKCLQAFFDQVRPQHDQLLEILISNNNSPDNTDDIVKSFIAKGLNVVYNRNLENIGPNANITGLFKKARGKYVWIFPDDDFLQPDCLQPVLDILAREQPGVLHVRGKWYYNEDEIQRAPNNLIETQTFDNPDLFCKAVHFWLTFATGNIVYKDILKQSDIENEKYLNTFLPQLGWYIPAIYHQRKNILVTTPVLYCKADNSGGYDLVNVFGVNFNIILNDYVKQGVMHFSVQKHINNKLLKQFFPYYIKPAFVKKYFHIISGLYHLYWKNIYFYYHCLLFPVLKKLKQTIFGKNKKRS